MKTKLTWDETKRQSNLSKHGLVFADAGEVLYSRYRFDFSVVRSGEYRIQSVSYALGFFGGAYGGLYQARRCDARYQLSPYK